MTFIGCVNFAEDEQKIESILNFPNNIKFTHYGTSNYNEPYLGEVIIDLNMYPDEIYNGPDKIIINLDSGKIIECDVSKKGIAKFFVSSPIKGFAYYSLVK